MNRCLPLILLLPAMALSPSESVAVFEGTTIIDGKGNPPISDGVVLVRNGRIVALGKSGFVRIPDSAERIDARGKWLIPGLIDMHVHLDEVIEPGEFLLYGITSVRDVGSRLVRIQRIRARQAPVPRIFWMGRNIDEGKPSWWGAVAAIDPDSVPALISDMERQGVDGVKLYTGAGPGVAKSVIEEAHRRGWPVTGHLQATPIAAAARLGIDNLEHVSTLFNQLGKADPRKKLRESYQRAATAALEGVRSVGAPTHPSVGAPTHPSVGAPTHPSVGARALINLLASRSVAITPTLASSEMSWRSKRHAEAVYAGWAQVPAAWSKYWSSDYWNFIKPVRWTPADYREAAAANANMRRMVSLLREARVPIVAGTDTPAPWCLPGAAVLHELELYVRCGLTPLEAIRAAAGRAAWILRKESEVGSISPGRRADLVLLDADPLQDIRNLRRIHAVYLNGRPVNRERILRSLREMKPPRH